MAFNDTSARATTLALTAYEGLVQVIGPPRAKFGDPFDFDQSGEPEGVWAEWHWDGSSLAVRNDRYGFFPLFLHATDERIVLSDSLLAMVRHGVSTELDDAALAVFLRLGFFLADRTPLRAVRTLSPASKLRWKPGKLVVESNLRSITPSSVVSRDGAIAAFGELFQLTSERWLSHVGDRMVVPLSGGRDSRHILLALQEAGRPPDACVTVRHFPPKPDEDARIASRVAAALDVPHIIIERDTDRFGAERRKNMLTHFCADEHAWMLALTEHLERESYTDLWDGIGGDVLSAGLFLDKRLLRLFEAGRGHELADEILPGEGYLPNMLSSACYARWAREKALEEVAAELERHRTAANPVGQFYFWNRTRREIALGSWCLLAPSTRVLPPFLTAEVYDFLTSLPASYFLDHTFHTEAIARRYPAFASLPYEHREASQTTASRLEVARFVLQMTPYSIPWTGRSSWLRPTFLAPRLALGLLNQRYGSSLADALRLAIYISQLEEELREIPSEQSSRPS